MAEKDSSKINLPVNFKWISLALLLTIIIMLIIWKPWANGQSDDRTVSVTGKSTQRAVPDEYSFYPTYEFKNSDKQAAINEANAKSKAIVAELQKLGVSNSMIKTSVSGYRDYYVLNETTDSYTYNLSITIRITDQDLAEEVQEYLITTTPAGAVSPNVGFSDAKQKELEAKAREEATKDARSKADQMADNLGFNIGKVKSVSDGTGFGVYGGSIEPAFDVKASDSVSTVQANTINPGENELEYNITVVYYLR